MNNPPFSDSRSKPSEMPGPPPVEEGIRQSPKIDVQELAKEIYLLMKEELRHERERRGQP